MQQANEMPVFYIPDGQRVYAVGDIHGFPEAVERMEALIATDMAGVDPASVSVIYLGDYIDRGPDARATIEALSQISGQAGALQRRFLEGNHERYLFDFIETGSVPEAYQWLQWGGRATLLSYGIELEDAVPLPSALEKAQADLKKRLPPGHLAFLKALRLQEEVGDYLFVHAGVNPSVPLSEQSPRDLQNIRQPFLSWPEPLPKKIVHGHTVSKAPQNLQHRLGIDTGLYQGGALTCAVIEGADVRFMQVKPGSE
jgi:serine/threonine protein phosphatase 1